MVVVVVLVVVVTAMGWDVMRIEIVRSGIWLIRLPTPICGPFGTHIR